jgi:hypothetical protein
MSVAPSAVDAAHASATKEPSAASVTFAFARPGTLIALDPAARSAAEALANTNAAAIVSFATRAAMIGFMMQSAKPDGGMLDWGKGSEGRTIASYPRVRNSPD